MGSPEKKGVEEFDFEQQGKNAVNDATAAAASSTPKRDKVKDVSGEGDGGAEDASQVS